MPLVPQGVPPGIRRVIPRVALTNLRNVLCHSVRRIRKFVRVAQQQEVAATLLLLRNPDVFPKECSEVESGSAENHRGYLLVLGPIPYGCGLGDVVTSTRWLRYFRATRTTSSSVTAWMRSSNEAS